MEAPNKPPENKGDKYKAIAKYSGLGFELVAAILIPVLIGQRIDNRNLNSEVPVFTLIFGCLGIAYALYKVFKISSN